MGVRIERQDYHRRCDHDNVRRCHASGPDPHGAYWHTVPMWHAWDDEMDDYAVEPLYRRRDVVAALRNRDTRKGA